MRKLGLITCIFSTTAFANHGEEIFYCDDKKDETLLHIAYDEEEVSLSEILGVIEESDFDEEGLSLFKMDMDRELPWNEEMTGEEINSYVEKKVQAMTPDYDDVFSYDLQDQPLYKPSKEPISEDSRHLLGRPRVFGSRLSGDPLPEN